MHAFQTVNWNQSERAGKLTAWMLVKFRKLILPLRTPLEKHLFNKK
jgi:hypothetical protein